MFKTTFKANYAGEEKQVELSEPSPNSGFYHVIIDKFYEGSIFLKDGTWEGHLATRSDLTFEDIQILGEKITEAHNNYSAE